VGPC